MNAIQLARLLHDHSDRMDMEAILAMTAPDVEATLMPTGQTLTGREGFRQFVGVFHTAFPDLAIAHERAHLAGDTAIVECTWTGTHRGPLQTPAGTIPPTGRRASSRFVEIMTWRDGKLVRLANYQDLGSWLRQLGV